MEGDGGGGVEGDRGGDGDGVEGGEGWEGDGVEKWRVVMESTVMAICFTCISAITSTF